MKKRKNESEMNIRPDIESRVMNDPFFKREEEREKRNKLKNKPIVFVTYVMVFIFIGMFSYLIYFQSMKAESIIANASNKRQNTFAETIIRGDIITSDRKVIATTVVSDNKTESRYYPEGKKYCHITGYNSYGRTGVELAMNFQLLRSHQNIFTKVGTELKSEKNYGDNVILTIDSTLQEAAYKALGDNKGAVIVMEPDTGKILAMVSKPGYDPNDIDNVWASVHSEEGSSSTVLLNRVTQGLYAPGSTFKVITVLEYMRENPNYKKYSYECTSQGVFNSVSIHCSNEKAHGEVTVADTLAKSCNTSISNMSGSINIASLKALTEDFLYNSDIPYDGDYVKSKFVLDDNSDRSLIPQTVIGQGNTQITPINNLLIISSIANGGVMMKPYIVDSIENHDGGTITKYKNKAYKTVMTTSEAKILTEMLEGVCTYGTAAKTFAGAKYTVAGKTGTVEYDNNGNCNSWFIGFSNVDNPDIAISVVVEDYTKNKLSGMKVAKDIFDAYYK